ncbi:cupredoxin domain-containing protein [Candidatus Woesearchaeota archaeon]|nr:cupredoxin domain-containing protein [Candidatus Woesearchaeota archaeon]
MEIIKCEACNKEFNSQEALGMHNSAKHNVSSNDESFEISRKTVFFIIGVFVILVVALGGYFFISGKLLTENSVSGNAVYSTDDANSNNIQKITLGFNGNYYPNTITVEVGKPVEITLDSSVRGCYRSFNIGGFGVSYRSSDPSDAIKFIPNKKGKFEFKCGMGMGRGTIIVE